MNRRARRLLVPTLSTAVMLVVLVGLGNWQVRRLHWKLGILHQIATAEASPPVALGAAPAPYTKVSASGHFRPGALAWYGSSTGSVAGQLVLGAQQLAVLDRAAGPPVLVDRGWVPLPAEARAAPPAGPVTVTGYIDRPSTPNWFSATDDVKGHHFYTLAPATIARALGIGHVAPFTLVALGAPPAAGIPRPAQHLPRPRNPHLQYAITWYGFALTLLIFYALYTRKVLRS